MPIAAAIGAFIAANAGTIAAVGSVVGAGAAVKGAVDAKKEAAKQRNLLAQSEAEARAKEEENKRKTAASALASRQEQRTGSLLATYDPANTALGEQTAPNKSLLGG